MPDPLQPILWMLPAVYFAAALASMNRRIDGWRVVAITTRLALASSLVVTGAAVWNAERAAGSFGSPAAVVFTALIAFLGWIIGDYCSRYLQGEPGQRRFRVAFLFTLASVTAVAVTSHLGVMILAWSLSSAGLHHLLTFYRDRSPAILVAHKKFLASRLAEICLIAAAVLLYRECGTLEIPLLLNAVAANPMLPAPAAAAAVLIATAVLIKSAQLPLHGWLIQVMEAPTPVSALLHAGIVNLGAYVLIRLAPLIAAATAAQTLLVVVGGLTAGLAGLVMMTRVTIKVRLAWSTCSQMGFTMLECGLGLYDLALLHILAHALYKAHAFLTAGETVRASLEQALLTNAGHRQPRAPVAGWIFSLALAWGIILGSSLLWERGLGAPPVPWTATAILACGLATLLWPVPPRRSTSLPGLLALLAATQVYLAWHALLAGLMEPVARQPGGLPAGMAVAVLVALYFAQAVFSSCWLSSSTGRVYRWIYAGFYLDEYFTHLTRRLWPVHITSGG